MRRSPATITQNGNAYAEGLGGFWADTMEPYWKDRNPATEKCCALSQMARSLAQGQAAGAGSEQAGRIADHIVRSLSARIR
jgi:hypothetical protein